MLVGASATCVACEVWKVANVPELGGPWSKCYLRGLWGVKVANVSEQGDLLFLLLVGATATCEVCKMCKVANVPELSGLPYPCDPGCHEPLASQVHIPDHKTLLNNTF